MVDSTGILYKINDHFHFGLNYKYEKKKGAGKWTEEHRAEIIPITKLEWQGLKIDVHTRFDYKDLEIVDKWLWREKIKIKKKQVRLIISRYRLLEFQLRKDVSTIVYDFGFGKRINSFGTMVISLILFTIFFLSVLSGLK